MRKTRRFWRCIKYRKLNQFTVKKENPLHLIDLVYEHLHSVKIFIKLSSRNASHLVKFRAGDDWKTPFREPLGHFEYLIMLFGLTNAPAVFHALVNYVLRDFLDVFVFLHLDDTLIYSEYTQKTKPLQKHERAVCESRKM